MSQVLNPITPHGSVVVNAAYDYTHYTKASAGAGGGDAADHRIEKKDLVFCDKNLSKRKRSSYNEPDLHVLASTNGVAEERLTRDNYAFIGVSNTHLDANSHRHAAITVAGLTTIRNTGTKRIEVGDRVVWDIADHDAPRGGKRRKVFRTIAYHEAFEADAPTRHAAVHNAIKRLESATPGPGAPRDKKPANDEELCARMFVDAGFDAEAFEKMKSFLRCYALATAKLDSRVIGTALSKAEEGFDFDILVRHSH